MSNRTQTIDSKKIRLVAPAAVAAASGLLSPTAWSAPGDLDPSFGDVGRAVFQALGGAVEAVVADGGDVLVGGGVDVDVYYGYYVFEFDGFVDRLDGEGVPDTLFGGYVRNSSDILDLARQSDGKVVGVGTAKDLSGRAGLLVLRLNADGTLDDGFGDGGSVLLPDLSTAPLDRRGEAVIVEPDGRITVAGSEGGRPIVIRLTPSGALDLTFASGGLYRQDSTTAVGAIGGIVRTATGGYRVALNDPGQDCRLLALTAAGAVDVAVGEQGTIAAVSDLPGIQSCAGLVPDSDGHLLVAGTSAEDGAQRGFATRLGPDGTIDPGFDAADAAAGLASVSALTAGGGSVYLAGPDAAGSPGQAILRLDASGALDVAYGDRGWAWFDFSSESDYWGVGSPAVRDLDVLPDGRLLAGGGTSVTPVVARYLGDAGGDSPGILGVVSQNPEVATEASGVARVLVRRIGGSAGAVSVGYAAAEDGRLGTPATAGSDFTPVAGRLEWADGEVAPKEILVPLARDAGETYERFAVRLSDPQGGAGLGTDVAVASILSDGYPAGLIGVYDSSVPEGRRASISVYRIDFGAGSVSVTLTVASGAALEGTDYERTSPVTLTWADGEIGVKSVTVDTIEDGIFESAETFSVTLSNPTGGATLANAATATVTILDNDVDTGGSGRGRGGGGSIGGLLTGLLGLLGFARRRARR